MKTSLVARIPRPSASLARRCAMGFCLLAGSSGLWLVMGAAALADTYCNVNTPNQTYYTQGLNYFVTTGQPFTVQGTCYEYVSNVGNKPVSKVEVYCDGSLVGEATLTNPSSYCTWSLSWSWIAGTHAFKAKAYFASGLTQESAIVNGAFTTTNTSPTAYTSRVSATPGTTATVTVYYDEINIGQSVKAQVTRNPANGTVVNRNVTGAAAKMGSIPAFTYQPNAGFTGYDSFAFKLNDSLADSNEATVRVQVFAVGQVTNTTVSLIVNANLYSVLTTDVNRLRDDLVSEGYLVKIKSWPSSGTTPSDVWNYLKSEYGDATQWFEGAILIGDIPKPRGSAYNDLTYWCMKSFNLQSVSNFDIWVSRINADDTGWGSQDTLIRRYLDANHKYRKGIARLPFIAYSFAVAEFSYQVDTSKVYLSIWPQELLATDVGFTTRTDLGNIRGADAFVAGGEILQETSHGNEGGFMANSGWFDKGSLYRCIAQIRFGMIESCSVAAPGGIVNNMLFTRGGGLIYAVSGTTINYVGDFSLHQSQGTTARNRLAAGDAWGRALLAGYPFYANNRTIHYGDLSIKPKACGAGNAMPAVTLTASKTMPAPGETVTFTIAVTDPDAGASDSPYVDFEHQCEWFLDGYNGGRNAPTVVTNSNQAGWTSVSRSFAAAGAYTVRAEVMDEWMARTWRELTLTVNSLPLAANDSITIEANHAATIAVLTNDADPDGQAISIKSFTQGAHGTVSQSGSALVYTPAAGWTGVDSFTYTIRDTLGATATATVSVTVAPDVTAPLLVGAACLGTPNCVTATFNEKMLAGGGVAGAENPANYAIDRGVAISAAVLQADGKTVKLTTTSINPGITYTLTANSVKDLSGNAIVSNSQKQFKYTPMVNGLTYEYYHGTWASGGYLPDFNTLTPVKTGTIDKFDLSPRTQDTNFAFRYTGKIQADTGGTYTFYTNSDDGSKLYINGTAVVNNDGPHGMVEKSGTASLGAGLHDIQVTFCQGGGGFGLIVRWEGPGIAKQEIAGSALYHVIPIWEVPLVAGYNLVALPARPGTAYTAESLAVEINARGGSCVAVIRYAGGNFETHPVGTAVNNFTIDVGSGYFLRCQGTGLWWMTGSDLSLSPVSLPLQVGYNLVSLPVSTTRYTAESAATEINGQGGIATQVIKYENGQFKTHPTGTAVDNFPMIPGVGYFIRCQKVSAWAVSP
jgi:hypothetical protein